MVHETSLHRSEKLNKLLAIGLGSNLGDRFINLQNAITRIGVEIGKLVAKSLVYETEPFGVDHKTTFLNQVAVFSTELNPEEVLNRCQKIEIESGRKTKRDLAPRTIDIDILILGNIKFASKDLQIPHPEISKRKFVLVPLAEILPFFSLPGQEKTVSALLKTVEQDRGWVKKYSPEL